MKKHTTLCLSLLVFHISLFTLKAQTANSSTVRTWKIIITPQSTKHYLDSLSEALKKDSIDLNFSLLKYNSSGELVKIKGYIDIMAKGAHARKTFTSEGLESLVIKVNTNPSVIIKGN